MPQSIRLGCIAIILALAFISRLPAISRGLGQDELFSTVHFIESGSFWTTISSNAAFNNHVGYSVMARICAHFFGASEWSLRLPALVLGIAALCLLWIFSESILPPSGALMGVLLLALSPAHVVWSVEARGYSGMIFFTLLSSIFYFRLLRCPTRLGALGYILANVGGIYTHLYSIFVLAIQSLIFVQLVVSTRLAKRAGIAITPTLLRLFFVCLAATAALLLVAYAPIAGAMWDDLVGRGHGRFDPAFPWAIIQRLSGSQLFSVTAIMFAIAIFGAYSLWKSRPLEVRYLIWLLAVPILLTWVAVKPFDLYPRFFAYWLPFYVLSFIAGLEALWNLAPSDRNFLRLLPRGAAVITLVGLLSYWIVNRSDYIPDEGYREASSTAMSNAHEGVRYCAIGGARSVWRYYIHQPIAMPASLKELHMLGRSGGELRCVYYDASWQDDEQRKIAEFLRQHARWQKIKDLTVFRYAVRAEAGAVASHNLNTAGG